MNGEGFGFIVISRKFFDDWQWADVPNMVHTFMHIIHAANYKTKEWKGITIERGQFVISVRNFAAEIGLSYQTLRTCLDRLVKDGTITSESVRISTSALTKITVCNYDTYQFFSDSEQRVSNASATHQQRVNNASATRKEIKKINITTTTAHVREEEFSEQCKADRIWLERAMMQTKLSEQAIADRLKEFVDHSIMQGESHDDLQKFKYHFCSWLRIRLQEEDKKLNNEKVRQDTQSKRRSTDVIAKTAEEYGTTF